jgi:hypothetical protein
MALFSQLLRPFFRHFANRAFITHIFAWKSTRKALFSPKYRGKVLLGDVAEVAEEIIRETCKELDIEIIDMAMNVRHGWFQSDNLQPKTSFSIGGPFS